MTKKTFQRDFQLNSIDNFPVLDTLKSRVYETFNGTHYLPELPLLRVFDIFVSQFVSYMFYAADNGFNEILKKPFFDVGLQVRYYVDQFNYKIFFSFCDKKLINQSL